MIPTEVTEKFSLLLQDKRSPDGYKIYISEKLSQNGPTVFFELMDNKTSEAREKPGQPYSFRITKAGSVNHITISLADLESQSFTDLQQAIETGLHIPA
jgi:hypothetical protein